MYREIARTIPEKLKGKILGISGLDDLRFLIDEDESSITEAFYPEVDIHKLPYPDNEFDVVISDQVLEHVTDPALGIEESRRVLKPGGIAIHTTCFVNYYHPSPIDYWRMSPAALEYCCRDFSEIITAEGWGNLFAFCLTSLGERFRALEVPERKWSLIHQAATRNNEKFPITTWVIAKK